MDAAPGLLLARKIVDGGVDALKEFLARGLDDTVFLEEERRVVSFVRGFWAQYGTIPSHAILEHKIGVKLPDAPEALHFYVDEIRNRHLYSIIAKDWGSIESLMKERRPQEAFDALQRIVFAGSKEGRERSLIDAGSSAAIEMTLEAFRLGLAAQGLTGIQTPWPTLDAVTLGWQKGDLATIIARPGLGKAQPIDAKVLTPTGWAQIGDLHVGDRVVGSDGKPTTITGVFPQGVKEVYRVGFSDGSSTECCDEHLWSIQTWRDKGRGRGFKTFPFKTIRETLGKSRDYHYFIPMIAPVQFEGCGQLPIDPYLLGALLGDGCLRQNFVRFTSADEEILESVRALIPPDTYLKHIKGYDYQVTRKSGSWGNTICGLVRSLGLNNLLAHEKHIPEIYLRASVEDRVSLLQGLLDTDGHVRPDNNIEFSSTSRALIDGVRELVLSFGGAARIRLKRTSYTYRGEKKIGRLAYRTSVILPGWVLPFRLSRKAKAYHPRPKYPPMRAIVSAESTGCRETVCIAVDAPDQLYATDDYILTHNTYTMLLIAYKAWTLGHRILFLSMEMPKQQILKRLYAIHARVPVVRILRGEIGDFEFEPIEQAIREIAGTRPPFVIVDEYDRTATGLQALVDEYTPGLVLVDGFYLMRDEEKAREKHERIGNLARAVHLVAKRKNVPIIISTQFNREVKAGALEAGLENIGLSDEIGQLSSIVMALLRTERMEIARLMKFLFLKVREGESKSFTVAWDFATMDFLETEAMPESVAEPGVQF